MNSPTPEHWPTERMINEGHSDYATPEDLEALDDGLLVDIAQICEVDEYAPDECIPCLAHVTYLERQQAKLEAMNPPMPEITTERAQEILAGPKPSEIQLDPGAPAVFEQYTPYDTGVHFTPTQRLEMQAKALQETLDEVLNGPPIPPKDVTLDELASLVIGAEKWVQMIDAQGLELAPVQEAVKEEIQRVIMKVRGA